ncbi:sugar ABC transporter substrate-binding protein [Paenibacillus sp. CCS19]|uniref:ABC transporter substrate-binding protein n=1 Tax=Paenibacillus sp. CCS19 TaxID=3158387 RepID=UPI00256A1A50|nr:extracellular solute-binding protein [Paenibacillus cellulosilyticus]GMK38624.1 sugar ABC transporter substrate-binding protein [Paenibacillus cellulosilyticus]
MSRKWSIVLAALLSCMLVVTACSESDKNEKQIAESDSAAETDSAASSDTAKSDPVKKELSGELTFWTFGAGDAIEKFYASFSKAYPNVKVNTQILAWDEMQKNLKNAIATGTGGPDVVMTGADWLASSNMYAGVENLLEPPYNAGDMKDLWTDSNWNHWLSLDGKRLIGLPWDTGATLSWYRADLLEENGYPSDPKELASYMSNPEQFLEMAKALRAKDIYLLESNTTIMDIYTPGEGFFDRNLNFIRNTDKYVEGLKLAQQVKQLGLAFNDSAFWSEPGKQAIATGKIAMVYYANWISDTIKSTAPDLVGKWRETHLPFGNSVAGSGSTLAILSQSKNKELAWEFIKFLLATDEGQKAWIESGGAPGYKPAWSFPAYKEFTTPLTGDQKINEINAEAMENAVNTYISTPLDATAQEIWNKGIAEAIEKNQAPKAAIQQIADDIERAVKVDKDKLKAELGIQ